MSVYGMVAESAERTVLAEYDPAPRVEEGYQGEEELEERLLARLEAQGYERLECGTRRG